MGPVPCFIWYADHQGYWAWTLDQGGQFADIKTNGFDGGKICYCYKEDNTMAVPVEALDVHAKNNKMNRTLGGILRFKEIETRHV